MPDAKLLRQQPFKDRFAIVCGGSKGIGKATAREIVRLGGSVCLVAREEAPLQEAAAELEGLRAHPTQFVELIACDTSDMERLRPLFDHLIEARGIPDYLLNCVGFARPAYVQDTELADFQDHMAANYYGQLVPTLILLPYFLGAKKGHIAHVSSQLGFMGAMGYAAYAPSKYALVGLTEVLRNELKPYHLQFSILYPPDTDTPGFELENQTKPQEWSLTSQARLYSPEEIAASFVKGLLKKKFHILPGQAGIFWRLSRFSPGLVHWIADREYLQARRKLGKT